MTHTEASYHTKQDTNQKPGERTIQLFTRGAAAHASSGAKWVTPEAQVHSSYMGSGRAGKSHGLKSRSTSSTLLLKQGLSHLTRRNYHTKQDMNQKSGESTIPLCTRGAAARSSFDAKWMTPGACASAPSQPARQPARPAPCACSSKGCPRPGSTAARTRTRSLKECHSRPEAMVKRR